LSQSPTGAIGQALRRLGVRRLVLAIHDQSFPSVPDEETGRGSPYGSGARQLLEFAAGLGFNGVQLGPQGETTPANPSPYDGALFSKSLMSLVPRTLAEDPAWAALCEGLSPPPAAAGAKAPLEAPAAAPPESRPDRVRYAEAWSCAQRSLTAMHARFSAHRAGHPDLAARFAAFAQARQDRLGPDGDFEALAALHATDDWRRWPDGEGGGLDRVLYAPPPALAEAARRRRASLRAEQAAVIERHAFGQFALHEQHLALRRWLAAGPRLALFGDLQIGLSHRDVWSRRALFRGDYLMGAPPSRTNPAGQPWGFPVLDPRQYFDDGAPATTAAPAAPGPVLRLLLARIDGLIGDCDGLRIDHPHGLVCPWVYAADDPDAAAAVGRGARLFDSPNLADHPRLAALAIPTADQLSQDPGIARYADDWVQRLRDDQVAAYGVLFDAIMARVAAAGRRPADVVCEVLSTWPYPLRRVMQRYGLGRFCVLQKADLTRPDDVYRAENAGEADWIMAGNHDTPPVWLLASAWHGTAAGARWAAYLADRLMPAPPLRARFIRWVAADARHLCQAMFAALFTSRARQVSVFFADLFGLREIYNRPGLVDDQNWTLRLPGDWQALYRQRVAESAALNMPLALALALAARQSTAPAEADRRLAGQLLGWARRAAPALDDEIAALIEAALAEAALAEAARAAPAPPALTDPPDR
jgi:4-alpha-glucanotransferase